MKKYLPFALIALLFAVPAQAQVSKELFAGLQYDVDSTSLTYCTTSEPAQGPGLVKTTGSSATVASFTTSSGALTGLAVGDVLQVLTSPRPGASTPATGTGTTLRVVTAIASVNSITVDAAIDLSATGGYSYSFYRNTCGTAATNGWVSVPNAAQRFAMSVSFEQGDIANLVARWECKQSGIAAPIVIVYPGESSDCGLGAALATDRCIWAQAKAGAADGNLTIVDDAPVFAFCRVGLAYTVSDTAETTTTLEKVTVKVTVR